MTPDQLKRIRLAVERHGTTEVAGQLGISRETLARLIGGLPVRDGTEALALANIAKVKA